MGLKQKAIALLQQEEKENIPQNDFQEKERLHRRQEMLLNLLELERQLVNSNSEQQFWKTLSNTITAQTGATQIAVFFQEEDRIVLKEAHGYTFDPNFRFPVQSKLIDLVKNTQNALVFKDIVNQLQGREFVWLKSLQPSLLVPLYHFEEFAGLFLLGIPLSKNGEQTHYSNEEKIYLILLGEILGYFYENVKKLLYSESQKQIWSEREHLQNIYNLYIQNLEICQSVDQGMYALKNFLSSVIQEGKYSLLYQTEEEKFTQIFSVGLQPETVGRLRFSNKEKWIQESRGYNGWSLYKGFREDKNLFTALEYEKVEFEPKDNTVIYEMHSLPLYMHGFLEGIFLVFNTTNHLKEDGLHYIQSAINNFIWFRESMLSASGNETLQSVLKKALVDPLFSVRSLYQEYESEFRVQQKSYALIALHFSNLDRLRLLLGERHTEKIEVELKNHVLPKLQEHDLFSRISPQRYLILLKYYNESDCYRFAEEIEQLFRKNYQEKERPILQIKNFSRVQNPFVPFEELFL